MMTITVEKTVGGGTAGDGGGSPSKRMAKEELNKAYQVMLHQRRDAVSGQSGDEAMLRIASTKASTIEQQNNKEDVCGVDEKCLHKCRGLKKEPAKKWTSALRVVAAMTRFKNMPKIVARNNDTRCATKGISRALQSDQQHSPPPLVMATSPKVRALRRGTSTAMSSNSSRPSLISQRSLQCAIIGSPKLRAKVSATPTDQQRNNGTTNSSQGNEGRKISAGAYYFYAPSSTSSSPYTPNEAFPGHFTPPSAGAGPSHAIDAPQFHSTPPLPYLPLYHKHQQLANVRANSNPTICCRRGGVERRRILRRSPNSDLAPRFQRHSQKNNEPQYSNCDTNRRHPQQQQQDEWCSRGSSFSNESTPGRNGGGAAATGGGAGGSSTEQGKLGQQQTHDPDNIDPVYLALKQATEKYGTPAGSRRGSQSVGLVVVDSLTPSPRDLSQTSLQDSGTYSGSECCGPRQPFVAGGSTPHLHGISVGKSSTIFGNGEANRNNCQALTGGRRPKLSEKMKSLSLDCAETPDPVQSGMLRPQHKTKPSRSARGLANKSVQQSFDKSASPIGRPESGALAVQSSMQKPRRLPPVPSVANQLPRHQQQQQAVFVPQQQQQQQQAVFVPQQQLQQQQQHPHCQQHNNGDSNNNIMHIIIHEYSSGECVLRPGDRVVVVDNGDPDWKHGFKFNDCLERLLTFPSSCVAAYQMEEQPMKLSQSCNLVEQKIRLYRDQIVFAQPNGLSGEGRLLLVRNEHNKLANCPLQFLTLA